MNELTKTNIRLHAGNLTVYVNSIGELRNWIYDNGKGFARIVAEVFEQKNNNWKQIAI